MGKLTIICLLGLLIYSQSLSQTQGDSVQVKKETRISLSGPRFGVTILTGDDAKRLKDDFNAPPVISQFGWQFELQFISTREGFAGLSEWIPLVGGVEHGIFLPSLTWLVGLRTSAGTEFGAGPSISVRGAALILSGGITLQTSSLNVPLNFAVTLAKGGTHFSFLAGFNARD